MEEFEINDDNIYEKFAEVCESLIEERENYGELLDKYEDLLDKYETLMDKYEDALDDNIRMKAHYEDLIESLE